MAKTRAEIQKAYRERKKQKDPNFLANERLRQSKYKVPAEMLSKKKLKLRQQKSREYCLKYRLRKNIEKSNQKSAEHDVALISETQSGEVSSSCDVSSSVTTAPPTRSTKSSRLLVNFRFGLKSPPGRRRSNALKKARSEIKQLQEKLDDQNKKARRFQKRYERLSLRASKPSTSSIPVSDLTPKSKTIQDLRVDGISPSQLPRSVVRRLQVSNCVLSEIKSSLTENTQQSHTSAIHRVVSGKIVKKYRCISYLKKSAGISRRHTAVISKKLTTSKRQRQAHFRSQLTTQVVTFLERDDNSRCMPGKRDATNVDGEKKQIRILNDYLQNLHDKFRVEHPTVIVSFSAFCKMRPPNIHVTSVLSRNKCLCTKHQNMALKLKSLISHGVKISPNPEVVGRSLTTEQMSEKLGVLETLETVEYEEWRKVDVDGKKKMRIVKASVKGAEFVRVVANEYQLFLDHTARVASQYRALHQLKQDLPHGHVIVQMDFAENFLCQTMDEIQSAYWNATAATIHPVVIYHRTDGIVGHTNLTFVSDVNHHNSTSVCAILHQLVPEIKQLFQDVTYIHYWTDSPSSQYRNRFMFSIIARHLQLFDVSARWNYFEAGHGKGPCDGIGGTSKRMAAQAIKQGKATIQDGHDFYLWARQNQQSITYHFYSQNEYDAASEYLISLGAKSVPGTLKLHAVCSNDNGTIYVRDTSCYCPGCLHWNRPCDGWVQHVLFGNPQVNEEQEHHEETVPATQPENQPEHPESVSSSSVSSTSIEPAVSQTEQAPFIPSSGQFVAALYDNDWYVGKILEVDMQDSDTLISFMAKHTKRGKTQLQWPARADEIWLPFHDVLLVVAEPEPVGRSKRYFTLSDTDQESLAKVLCEKRQVN